MYIVGIDYSMSSPGIVVFVLDDNLEIKYKNYLSFTNVKKIYELDKDHLIYYPKNYFKNYYEKAETFKNEIVNFIVQYDNVPDYVAIEGYSYSSKGKIFEIAESTACLKFHIYNESWSLRIHDPDSIKMFATGNGHADKELMKKCYDEVILGNRFDLSHFNKKDKKCNIKSESPECDIIDAYWIAKLLQTELQIRKGILLLKDLKEHQIRVFNRCTKANPVNLLDKEFIQK
jgi:hypothetical protein